MNYTKNLPDNSYENIQNQNLESVNTSETSKHISKYYKTINLSLLGNTLERLKQSQVKTTVYAKPLYITVLTFDITDDYKESYSIDVSFFFSKPPRTIILEHLSKTKISKRFAHWVDSDALFKKQSRSKGFRNINHILGSAIYMHQYRVCVNSSIQRVSLTKAHLSYLVAQTLCKTQYVNGITKAYYSGTSSIIGAFVFKSYNFNPVSGDNTTAIYYLSDYELKQCALANLTQKQTIGISQWEWEWASSNDFHSTDKNLTRLQRLLGDTSTSSELVRTSIHSNLSDRNLINQLQAIMNLGALGYLKQPLHQFIKLLILLQKNKTSFTTK